MRAWMIAATVAIATPALAALSVGTKAPDFTTKGALAGKQFRLHLAQQLRSGPVVLYFFPAAFTPGCNAEAKAFATAVPEFRAAGATVIGMSADDIDKLIPFSTEHCAGKFPVASADAATMQAYDVVLDRKYQGRTLTNRTSFVIGRDGRIAYVHTDMNPVDHVRNTLAAVRALPH